MVWIYGGGCQFGATAEPRYDGSILATQGVVVVSMNYRLGALGFLASSQLDAEAGTSGNYGLLDEIAALQWVQQNIANFGGDPSRVTIFGESAGAHAVGLLLASPLTRGLVGGGILESGAFWETQHGSLTTHAEQVAKGADYVASFPPGTDLRAVDALTAMRHGPWDYASDPTIRAPGYNAFAPSLDGSVLRVTPAQAYARGQVTVPMLGGWNTAEYIPFATQALPFTSPAAFTAAATDQFGPRCMPQFQALYPASDAIVPFQPQPVPQTQASADQLEGDLIIAEQTWEALAIPRPASAGARYAYHFTYTSPYSPVASHTTKIPFVFGTLTPEYFAPTATPADADRQVSALIVSYWTNFAKKGDPNGPGLPFWPAFTGLGGQVMQIDSTTPSAGANTDEARFSFLASYRSHGRRPESWRMLGPGSSAAAAQTAPTRPARAWAARAWAAWCSPEGRAT